MSGGVSGSTSTHTSPSRSRGSSARRWRRRRCTSRQRRVGELTWLDGVAGGQMLGGGHPDRRQEGLAPRSAISALTALRGCPSRPDNPARGPRPASGGRCGRCSWQTGRPDPDRQNTGDSSCIPPGRASRSAARWLSSRSESAGSDHAGAPVDAVFCHITATMGASARGCASGVPASAVAAGRAASCRRQHSLCRWWIRRAISALSPSRIDHSLTPFSSAKPGLLSTMRDRCSPAAGRHAKARFGGGGSSDTTTRSRAEGRDPRRGLRCAGSAPRGPDG